MPSKYIYVPYDKAIGFIQESDLFLVRGRSWYSFFIGPFTGSKYTHVGMLSWSNGDKKPILEGLQFTSNVGGATVNFLHILERDNGRIDIFRPILPQSKYIYNSSCNVIEKLSYYPDLKDITKEFRYLTGLPYSYYRILWMLKYYGFVLRFFTFLYDADRTDDDEVKPTAVYPVCSTSISWCFNKHGVDLVRTRSDERTSPGDIALSTQLSYLFTPYLPPFTPPK